MFGVIKRLVTIETLLVACFLAVAILQGGGNLRILGEVTGFHMCFTLADEADSIRGKAFSMINGVENEAVERVSISNRTGRILKEYKKEL